MTNSQASRLRQTIVEVHTQLDKELNYSADLQKSDRVEFLRLHLAKLQNMLQDFIDADRINEENAQYVSWQPNTTK